MKNAKEYTRSDLAVEADRRKREESEIVHRKEWTSGRAKITEIVMKNPQKGEKKSYTTLSYDRLWEIEGDEFDRICTLIALEIRKLTKSLSGKEINNDFCVLVAGLGNSDITADSVGPLTAKKITVTRHLRNMAPQIYEDLGVCEISAFLPGVLGQTGIETLELIRGAVENSEPDIVIAVDALAARSCERLATTVQLSDSGINPGSGIGNIRKAISRETLGVPVMSLGVPTVVDSSTLVYEALSKAGIENVSGDLRNVLENGKSFFVTPKESDVISEGISSILAESITRAFTVV